ncbi:MAG: hypothetical protein OXG72_15705 [Acidobacteria bacterium]|nr:hypothetical protein [Acidobacteriota bacterium]
MSDSLSFGGLLDGVQWLFPRALLSGDGLERLLAAAERLPLCVIDRPFGFEFALCNEAADADFCVISAPGSPLAGHYIRAGAAAPSGSAASALGACLAENARDPASFLASRDGSIILEYDVPAHGREAPPPPGIFFVPGDASVDAARKLLDDPADTVAALWGAAGLRADPAELRQVERVYEVFSDAALVVQAGALPGRPQRAVRLVVHRIDTTELPGLLARLRWPGPADAVLSVTAATNDLTTPGAVLSLDVSASGVSPRLGLELFRPVQRFSVDRTGWRPMIERLTDRRWCVPAKAEGLRAWPRTERLLGPHGAYRVYQYINHIKAVVDHGRIAAKAYVAMVVRRFGG